MTETTTTYSKHAILITPDDHFAGTIIPFDNTVSPNHLAWLYFTLGCHTVDVVTPQPGSMFAGLAIDGWCDDEGLFVAYPQLNDTAMLAFGYPQLVGSVLLTGNDDQGNTLPLDPDVITEISKFLTLTPSVTTVG